MFRQARCRGLGLPRNSDVRDSLPVVCNEKRFLKRFCEGKLTFAEAVERAEDAGGDNADLQRIKKFSNWLAGSDTDDDLIDNKKTSGTRSSTSSPRSKSASPRSRPSSRRPSRRRSMRSRGGRARTPASACAPAAARSRGGSGRALRALRGAPPCLRCSRQAGPITDLNRMSSSRSVRRASAAIVVKVLMVSSLVWRPRPSGPFMAPHHRESAGERPRMAGEDGAGRKIRTAQQQLPDGRRGGGRW